MLIESGAEERNGKNAAQAGAWKSSAGTLDRCSSPRSTIPKRSRSC